MAEEGDSGEKTHAPTGRRLSESRGQGMVAKSADLAQVLSMITSVLVLERISPIIWQKLQTLFRWGFTSPFGTKHWEINELKVQFITLVYFLLPDILILMSIVAFVGSMTTLLQTNFLWTSKLLQPKLKFLNPMEGLKRIFSIQNYVNLAKQILKLGIIAPIAYYGLMRVFPQFFQLMDLPLEQILPFTAHAAGEIFWDIMKLLLVLALLDYAYQKYRVSKQLKMSKVEVDDERKSIEGDEKTKLKIRAKALQRARQRMMNAVKSADVIVTNPTHYAVALNYTDAQGMAPIVVAKGADHLAARIREIGKHNGVPVIERKLLARTLYANVEVGHEIPYELYAAVAELLAYVFKLKGKNPLKKKKEQQAKTINVTRQ
jgi:flagellar biosynthetic protein FlhB